MEPASGVVVVPDEEQVGLIEEALGIEINQPVERAERRREPGREDDVVEAAGRAVREACALGRRSGVGSETTAARLTLENLARCRAAIYPFLAGYRLQGYIQGSSADGP